MLEKYGKKLFILLGCDVVYFILWVIPAIRIPASSAIFTGLGTNFSEKVEVGFQPILGCSATPKSSFLASRLSR